MPLVGPLIDESCVNLEVLEEPWNCRWPAWTFMKAEPKVDDGFKSLKNVILNAYDIGKRNRW